MISRYFHRRDPATEMVEGSMNRTWSTAWLGLSDGERVRGEVGCGGLFSPLPVTPAATSGLASRSRESGPRVYLKAPGLTAFSDGETRGWGHRVIAEGGVGALTCNKAPWNG